MRFQPPEVGGWETLSYGECECGWRCACPEGAMWPKCPDCGLQVMPMMGREERLEYAAQLLHTIPAVTKVRKENGGVGRPEYEDGFMAENPRRHYTPEEIRAQRERAGKR